MTLPPEQQPASRDQPAPASPPDQPEAAEQPPFERPPVRSERGAPGAAVLGAILITLGIVFLVGQQLQVDLGEIGWPFYVIAPGIAILVLGLTQRGGSGLAIAGSIVTIVGLVLLYQNTTDHWESWAYAWALVGPGGSGVGMLLFGARSANASMMRTGFWQILTAVGLFVAGFVFFEGVIGISGRPFPFPDWLLPAVIIVFGVVLLFRGFTARRDWNQPSS